MKPLHAFSWLAFIMLLMSCTSTKTTTTNTSLKKSKEHTYNYKFYLEGSEDSSLTWNDERLTWNFTVGTEEVDFTVRNKTDQPLKIVWDEATIKVLSTTGKVMHKGVKYIDRNSAQPPTMIPPRDVISDLVVPTENVYYREGYYGTYYSRAGGWETKNLLLVSDMGHESAKEVILSTRGLDVINLMLPIQDGDGKTKYYMFKFVVKEVRCQTCPSEIPAPPAERKGDRE